jgi:predicted secreted protein
VPQLVRLTVVPTQGEADVVCSLLRADGIRCGDRTTDISADDLVGGWREILVDGADLESARALLAASER